MKPALPLEIRPTQLLFMKYLVLPPLVALMTVTASQGALVAYWNFNRLSISTASSPGRGGGGPSSIGADQGSGTISLAGWTGLVDDFSGTTSNALSGDPSEESLSLVGDSGNGSPIDMTVDLSNLEDPVITFATRGTGTGFDAGTWSYSIDGVNFTGVAGNTSSNSSSWAVQTVDFSAEDALDGESSVTFRYVLSGATSGNGNNRIDNLQINAVPEPAIAVLGLLGVLGLIRRRR